MITRLPESSSGVIGFAIVGQVTTEDAEQMGEQIRLLIESRGEQPIGILVDLSNMSGMDLQARWEEIRFLQKYTNHIARMAVVGAHTWEKISSMFVVAAALLQGETLYFQSSEMVQAWHWVRTSEHALDPPPPRITAASGIWKDYIPEYL